MAKSGIFKLHSAIPEQYRARFETERLNENISRMRGLSIYIVIMQLVLQVVNSQWPQLPGDGVQIPLMDYILLSLVTLVVGIVYWVLLTLAKRDKIKSHGSKVFLVNSLIYLYAIIQLVFNTLNIASRQGLNSYIVFALMISMVPILPIKQSAASIGGAFVYTMGAMIVAHINGAADSNGLSELQEFFNSDMRATLVIITGITLFVSAIVYKLYVSNFIKSVALENSNAHLEDAVRERTKELEAKTVAAEIASHAKSRFLTSMSHELRTPLNAIIGMAQVAEKAATKEKSDASVREISTAGDYLLGILNDILDMSNIESERLSIENERFLLRRAMDEVVNIIAMRCSEKALTFTNNVDALGEIAIRGDKLRLKQVLLTILDNAVKYTPEDGKVDFTINTSEVSGDFIDAEFIVSDTGIGIEEEYLQRVFIAFEQGATDNLKHRGTGLGLAISQSLVGMMGGVITVESTPGVGSVFAFKLRLETAAFTNETTELLIPDLTGKHILSVEDIEINRIILAELLAETHAEIDEAADGVEAVEKFIASPEGYYSFIFMDLLMPKLGGNDATRQIRNLDRPDATTVPIVALSANTYPDDIGQAVEAGMDSHLAKPIDFASVMRILAEKIK
jgi:signal transduction histidine kinase/CheY-like chemotaxis protein